MTEVYATLAALATVALALVAHRLRRVRLKSDEEAEAWKLRLELDLRQARKERDLLLDALDEAFLLVDREARILFANRSAHAMFPGRTLVGRTILDVFLERRLAGPILDCLENGHSQTSRVVLPRQASPSGPERRGDSAWVVDAARISETPDDAPEFRVVLRDVSPEHQAEQIRKDFVANASHELRTPLAIINGYLENLLDDGLLSDPELTRRFLTVMRKHTERIARIVEDMLVISRLESGEAAALKLKPFKIRSCISDVLERLESMIRSQKATVTVEMPDEQLAIDGDRFYWTQVLFNLVENALKQNPRPGLKVTVGCVRQKDGGIKIWVSDDGIGIPNNDLPHIFRRFYRVEKHHNQDEIKGTGLGLSIVKRAVEAHNGNVEVSSVPGEDTRFTIHLPAGAEEKTRLDAEARGQPQSIEPGG
jgi:signal transduction histidine kinase